MPRKQSTSPHPIQQRPGAGSGNNPNIFSHPCAGNEGKTLSRTRLHTIVSELNDNAGKHRGFMQFLKYTVSEPFVVQPCRILKKLGGVEKQAGEQPAPEKMTAVFLWYNTILLYIPHQS
jgi:hypothetical protein